MGNKRYRQDANKAAQSKSQTMRRKSSREPTSSDPKEQHNVVLPELGEKPRDMSSSQRSTESGSSRSSQRCSSYRESSQRSSSRSSKVSISVRDELEDKMDRMQASDLPSASSLKKKYGSRGNHATSQRSSSNTSEAYRSSRSGRQRSSRSCSSSGRHRRRVDMDGKVPHDATTVDNASLVYNTDSELSIDESTPGAYRVGSMGRISTLSPASHYEQSDGSHSDEERDLQAGVPPRSSRSRGSQSNAIESTLGSVSENTMVEAVAAQDIEDELNAARQRGRQEAMSEVARTDIAVAVAHDDDDNSRKGIDEAEARKRKKKFIVLFALFLIAIGVTTTMLLLFGRKQDAPAQLKNTEDSNAKVVVVYIPPTKEECEAIANGTFLGDQQSLIQKSFDIRIDITLGSENDFGPLFSAMLNHIQEKLIPIMAGCGAIDFFDTTMAITDELKNATNSIVNGKVEKESEKQCDGSNGNCRSYVLVLDLYLKEEQSSVSLMEVIGSAMNGDKLVNALGDFYPVETASVPWIIPSNSSIVVTSAPSVLGLETGVPTQLSDSSTAPILSIAPTFAPTFEMPLTYGGTNIPTNKVVTIRPTIVPDLPSTPSDSGPNSPSNAPIRVSTQTPTRMGTHRPTSVPSQSPTRRPTLQPTRDTAFAPTRNPTKGPSMAPVALPTPVVSKSPTDEPSSITSLSPTAEPTLKLSSQPTPVPSTSDISPSPSIQPSMSPTHYLCFQNNTELTNTVDDWFASAQLKASVEARYGLIGDWCFGEGVTSMDSLFLDRTDFNEAIGSWDISSVREIPRMFWGASSFNQDLSSWDVSLVRNMFRVFEDAISFNQDISPWDVSSAKSMSRMFVNTTSFNQDLSSWDVSSVFSMTRMFDGAVSFNQDLSSWDVPSVTKMDKMFHRASSFNQNLCPWGSSLRSSADVSDAFLYTNCPSTLQVNLTSNTKGPFCHVC